MDEDREAGRTSEAEDADEERPTRPAPRNPFEQRTVLDEDDAPALIESKRTAAISGVVAGLIALVLVVALCATVAYAFR